MEKKSFCDVLFTHFMREELFMAAVGFVICLTAGLFVLFLSLNGGYKRGNDEVFSSGELVVSFSLGGNISTAFNLEDNQILELPLNVENTHDDPFTYSVALNHVINDIEFEVLRDGIIVKKGEVKEKESVDLLTNVFLEDKESHNYVIKLSGN